jgi:hypothetical protein
MPKRRYERREPTHDWQQIQPLLKDPAQINYEVIRPVILWLTFSHNFSVSSKVP